MLVARLSVPYDKVLAFEGPDPVTGILNLYLAPQDVPAGLVAHAQVKHVRDVAADDPTAVIANFKDAGTVHATGMLRIRTTDPRLVVQTS